MLYFGRIGKHPLINSFFGEVFEKAFGIAPSSAVAVASDLDNFPRKDTDKQGDY